jgi:hypothetical protein
MSSIYQRCCETKTGNGTIANIYFHLIERVGMKAALCVHPKTCLPENENE